MKTVSIPVEITIDMKYGPREEAYTNKLIADFKNQIDDLKDQVYELESFLRSEDYRKCDSPACNCGSWHKTGLGMDKYPPPKADKSVSGGA